MLQWSHCGLESSDLIGGTRMGRRAGRLMLQVYAEAEMGHVCYPWREALAGQGVHALPKGVYNERVSILRFLSRSGW